MPPPLSLSILDQVGVASPCHESWEAMTGDERTRHCAACKLNVHNLSGMTRTEAESFLLSVVEQKKADPDARTCVSFYRRSDGTIITQDCPVGLALLKRKARFAAARAVAAIGAAVATVWAVAGANTKEESAPRFREIRPFAWISTRLLPQANWPPTNMPMRMGGIVCVPPPTPANAANGSDTDPDETSLSH